MQVCHLELRLLLANPRSSPDPPTMSEQPLTVAALTQRIAASLEDFGPLSVIGELSQVKVAPSGHLYATLKDPDAVISLVMWRSQVIRQARMPKDGERVVVRGSLSVYGPRGQYQLTASRISAVGAGDLAARLELLKQKLAAEGLFAEDRKRPLPYLPRAVGLATASGSAALADLLHSIQNRFPTMPVVVAPCLVQGDRAATDIVAALRRLAAHPEVDVIIAGRGGGSLEDLWAFNEEAVVRAIAACPLPVVSAVGHETDWTLADLVADVRAKTPTAAGELVVPELAALIDQIEDRSLLLDRLIDGAMADARARLASLAAHRALAGPGHRLAIWTQRHDELSARLAGVIDQLSDDARTRCVHLSERLKAAAPLAPLRAARERLAANAARLNALSPLAVIGRGYAVVRDAHGRIVRRIDQAPAGSQIQARVEDGWLSAEVLRGQRGGLGEVGDLDGPQG